MEKIALLNQEIAFKIAKKDNKNTYFYFRRDGYIQINLSKYQTKKQIITYMKKNEEYFLKKYNKICVKENTDPNIFKLWGRDYTIVKKPVQEIIVDNETSEVVIPDLNVDQQDKIINNFLKIQMLNYLKELQEKHQDNNYIDISNITLKTRYTTTRHGSCNPHKRTININLNLVRLEKIYTEYVFLHEITHLNEANHGHGFYSLLQKVCPEYNVIRQQLKLQR